MSKYTTEVRFICETYAGLSESKGYNNINDIIANSRAQIFDFEYPIFDTAYKSTLETKIIKHYYTREIGVETVGLWKHFLDMKMNEIMPYYNKLYESELIQFNPMYDVDYTREGTREENQDRTENETKSYAMTGTISDDGTTNQAMTGTVTDAATGSEVMTGTVTDSATGSEEMTGTVTDAATSGEAMTGTVTDVATGSDVMTGTVRDDGTSQATMTGTVTDDMTGTVRDNGTKLSQEGGSEAKNGSSAPKKSTWDLYSDTPQGGITGIEGAVPSSDQSLTDNAYLTNARHTIEDGTGSTESSTTNFGKTINETNDTTRTYNTENERTYDTEEDGETHNTRTYNTDNRTTNNNTKTYNTNNSTTSNNTKTYDTENNTTNDNTRTYDTDNRTTNNNTKTYDTDNDTTNNNVRTYDTLNDSEGSKTGNTATEGTYFERIRGKTGNRTYTKMLQELRETFLNIDLMIINELSDLFMNIY